MVATNGAATATVDRSRTVAASLAVLSLLVVVTPLPLGSVSRWAQAALAVVASGLLLLWLLRARRPADGRPGVLTWACLSAFGLIALAQIVPLPIEVVRMLSPEAAAAYASAGATGGYATLTLDVDATIGTLLRIAVFVGLFFVVAIAGRGARGIAWLSTAVVVAGVAQLVIGAYRYTSGTTAILGHEPTIVSPGLTGTFLSADHFAGYVGLALFVALGAWLGLRNGRGAGARGLRVASMICLACVVSFAAALVLSRSRSAMAAGCVTGLVFIVLVGRALSLRPRTIGMLAALASILVVGQLIALELIISWVDGGSSVVVNWADRFDLYRSTLHMATHFPWVGCGLGAGASVFPRFQSDRFGDRTAEHLHGDWLQVISEAGVVGGLALFLGCVLFWIVAYRRIVRVKHSRQRWFGIGALTSLAFAATHGLFEGSLLRVTANGVAAAVCAGIAYAAGASGRPVIPPRGRGWVVPICRGAAAAVVIGCVVTLALRRAVAEFEFNCHQAIVGAPLDRYFFLDRRWLRNPAGGEACIDTAVRLNPHNARYVASLADWQRARRARYLRREAEHVAAEQFGVSEGPAFGELVAALVRARTAEGDAAVQDLARSASTSFDRAVSLKPTSAELRLARATMRFADGRPEDRQSIREDATLAAAFAPEKPGVLMRAASLLVGATSKDTARVDADSASQWLARALATDPSLADAVADLVISSDGRLSLDRVLPRGGAGFRKVIDHLCGSARLSEAARALSAATPDDCTLEDRHYRAVRGVEVAGQLQRMDARRRMRDQLLAIERTEHDRACRDAQRAAPAQALATYAEVLARDPGHLGALAGALDARLGARGSAISVRDSARSLALRLAGEIAVRSIRGGAMPDGDHAPIARLHARLGREVARASSDDDRLIFLWTLAALETLDGDDERASRGLDRLADEVPAETPFAHLIRAHAASVNHRRSKRARAREQLESAVRVAPLFARAQRLAEALRVRSPVPAVLAGARKTHVLFGGGVELVAVRPHGEAGPSTAWFRVRASAPGAYRVTLVGETNSVSCSIGAAPQRLEALIPVRMPDGAGPVRCELYAADGSRLRTETGADAFEIAGEQPGVDR